MFRHLWGPGSVGRVTDGDGMDEQVLTEPTSAASPGHHCQTISKTKKGPGPSDEGEALLVRTGQCPAAPGAGRLHSIARPPARAHSTEARYLVVFLIAVSVKVFGETEGNINK